MQDLEKAKHYLEKLLELREQCQITLERPNSKLMIRQFLSTMALHPEDTQLMGDIFMADSAAKLEACIGLIDGLIAAAPLSQLPKNG